MNTQEQEQEQDVRIKICKAAAHECLRLASASGFREPEQIELFAGRAYEQATYEDKPDFEIFKKIYIAAYTKAQELLMHKPSRFSVTIYPTQIAANMKCEEGLYGFDHAYLRVQEKVEAATAALQENERTP